MGSAYYSSASQRTGSVYEYFIVQLYPYHPLLSAVHGGGPYTRVPAHGRWVFPDRGTCARVQ